MAGCSGMTETWRDIPRFEGIYQASNLGRVRGRNGVRAIGWRKDGYGNIPLYRDAVATTKLVHHCVLEAFVGPRPSRAHQACHNDGDKSNNRLENLRWDTPAANNADKKMHGTHKQGEDAVMAKLTETDVLAIRARRGERQNDLAAEFGCTFSNISAIQRRKSWRHV